MMKPMTNSEDKNPMTKRNLFAALLAAMLLLLTACGNSASTPPDPPDSQPAGNSAAQGETETAQPEDGDTVSEITEPDNTEQEDFSATDTESNILVVYFSRVGVTPFDEDVDATSSASINIRDGELVGNMQYLAEFIAEETSGDLFQIITEKEYPTDYRDTTDLAKEEQNNDERPALTSKVENMDQYDIIFLGYPNWWGTLPQAVMTFLEEYDFAGKTIIPFCSHGGSRLGSGPRDIGVLCPDANLLDGLAVSGSAVSSAQGDVQDWLEGLDLNI